MNKQQKLEANMDCAKLLGYCVNEPATMMRNECMVEMYYLKIREFNIFTNDSQCLEVVKKLLELGYYIKPVEMNNGFMVCKLGDTDYRRVIYNYGEAVAAAAMEVVK